MLPRENPFRSTAVERLRYRFVDRSLAELLANLARCNGRGAILGPCGSGKTTLLDELDLHFSDLGLKVVRLRFHRAESLKNKIVKLIDQLRLSDQIILIDGAELLQHWLLRLSKLIFRSAKVVVITTHASTCYKTVHFTRTTPQLLIDVSRELGCDLNEEKAISLYKKYRGDLRNSLRELYENLACPSESPCVIPRSLVPSPQASLFP